MRIVGSVFAVLVLAALGGVVGWYFWSSNAEPPLPPPPPWTEEMGTISTGNNQFAFDLYSKMRDKPGNLFFSPYSAHAALAMTATGAKGNTRDQMVKVLHVPSDAGKLLASGDLGQYYTHPRKNFELSVANAIWGQKSYPWRPEFLTPLREHFGAGFREADFMTNPNAERLRINTWAEEQTREKIKNLLPEGILDEFHRMVLVNAIYFKGEWEEQFDPKATRQQAFTLADGTQKQIPMMHRDGGFKMYHEAGLDGNRMSEFQVAEIPYKGGELSMVVLLPRKHDGLPALEAKLSAETLTGWLKKPYEAKDNPLGLPKFKIETEVMRMKEPLQQLGMKDAFNPDKANLTGMHSGTEQLYVDFVLQKAFVDVNEVGTEAAAATAVGVRATSAPASFIADRPFLFLIRDVKHGTILFMGRVMNPNG